MEGQGCRIIMGVTGPLLLGPFYYIALYLGVYILYESHCTYVENALAWLQRVHKPVGVQNWVKFGPHT